MSSFNKKFESAKQDWNTPQNLFDKLDGEFHFETDLAASKENTKCAKYFTQEEDGLKQKWEGVCWCNPPYGDKSSKMVDWIKKAYNDTQLDKRLKVVMLIPARTNTKWWHEYCMNAYEVKFIQGRPKFGGATHGLPQPLAIVVFYRPFLNDAETQYSTFKL